MSRVSGTLAVLALAPGVLALPVAACPPAEQGYRRLASTEAEVAYRFEPAELRVGQFFTADVVACRTPKQEALRDIKIDATMPAHGHGMNYRPSATRAATDHYRFTGLMLHMPGTWRVTFDLLQGSTRSRLTYEVNLKP